MRLDRGQFSEESASGLPAATRREAGASTSFRYASMTKTVATRAALHAPSNMPVIETLMGF